MKTVRTFAAAVALAGAFAASASVASAQDYRVAYGDLDLSTTAGAAALDARVDAVARQFCRDNNRPVSRLPSRATCEAAIREEAMENLPLSARTQYAISRLPIVA